MQVLRCEVKVQVEHFYHLVNAPPKHWPRNIEGSLGTLVPIAAEVSPVDEHHTLTPALHKQIHTVADVSLYLILYLTKPAQKNHPPSVVIPFSEMAPLTYLHVQECVLGHSLDVEGALEEGGAWHGHAWRSSLPHASLTHPAPSP